MTQAEQINLLRESNIVLRQETEELSKRANGLEVALEDERKKRETVEGEKMAERIRAGQLEGQLQAKSSEVDRLKQASNSRLQARLYIRELTFFFFFFFGSSIVSLFCCLRCCINTEARSSRENLPCSYGEGDGEQT